MKKPRTPGKGWRFMRPNERPHWKRGDEWFESFIHRWLKTGKRGEETVKESVSEYIPAYRRRLKPSQKAK